MIAGRLKYRITLMRPAEEGDPEFGQQVTAYVDVATVRAERVRFAGSRRLEASEPFADYRVEWNIRSAHCVSVGWRVKETEDQIYEIVTIEPNLDRGFNKLICERINQ